MSDVVAVQAANDACSSRKVYFDVYAELGELEEHSVVIGICATNDVNSSTLGVSALRGPLGVIMVGIWVDSGAWCGHNKIVMAAICVSLCVWSKRNTGGSR